MQKKAKYLTCKVDGLSGKQSDLLKAVRKKLGLKKTEPKMNFQSVTTCYSYTFSNDNWLSTWNNYILIILLSSCH